MESKNDMYQLHQEFVTAYKVRFVCQNMHVATVKASPMWQKLRKECKTLSSMQSEVTSQIKTWRKEAIANQKGTIRSLWNKSKKSKLNFSCSTALIENNEPIWTLD